MTTCHWPYLELRASMLNSHLLMLIPYNPAYHEFPMSSCTSASCILMLNDVAAFQRHGFSAVPVPVPVPLPRCEA